MTGLLFLVWVIALVFFVAGVVVGRAIQVWSNPPPSSGDYDSGYQDCLHALGWSNGYVDTDPPPPRSPCRLAALVGRTEAAVTARSVAVVNIPWVKPAWTARAACRGLDPELFYPSRGASTVEAKATCARCPVVDDCLQHAIDHRERDGIWGGLSQRQLRRLYRQVKRVAA